MHRMIVTIFSLLFLCRRRNENYSRRNESHPPELLKADVTTMVDTSIVKTIDEEGFLKRISKP